MIKQRLSVLFWFCLEEVKGNIRYQLTKGSEMVSNEI